MSNPTPKRFGELSERDEQVSDDQIAALARLLIAATTHTHEDKPATE